MKKLILFTFFVVSTGLSFSQFISFEYTQILIYSVEINYSSSSGSYEPWSPNLGFYSNAMAQLQARYDRNFNSLSKEYSKLKDLKLINYSNQSTLNNYRDERLYYIKNSISRWDLTIDSKYLQGRKYICEIYSYPSIKNEILLLQSCQKELNRIKYKDPDNFLYSKRYQSIMKTIEKLKNCSTSEIEELSWERTELENQNNNTSTINNYSSNNTSSIIGKPIKIGNLEVAQHDFPNAMLFYEAVKACTDLGNGWRLPTSDELSTIINNKDKIAGAPLEHGYLWISTGYYSYCFPNFYRTLEESLAGSHPVFVRAVRSF